MQRKTYLSNSLVAFGAKAQYDEEAKKIIADRSVLSRILKSTVKELRECSLNQIQSCIENVEISEMPVFPCDSLPQAITGMNAEDAVPGEGKITYDVRFFIITPDKQRIKIIINIEIQKDFYPGYDLVTRAIFYCCRMLSAQLDTEFSAGNYDDIKKVYSIWVCLDAPKKEANSIVSYEIQPRAVVGNADIKRHRYDLLNVIIIGIDEKSYLERITELHGYLGTIFSDNLRPSEKIRILNDDYHVKPTIEVEERIKHMCNLGDAVEARGIQKGIQKGIQENTINLIIKKIIKNKSMSEIAEELETTEADIKQIYDMVMNEGTDCSASFIYAKLNEAIV